MRHSRAVVRHGWMSSSPMGAASVTAAGSQGDPELPCRTQNWATKLVELSAPVIGEPAARALLARLWALDINTELP